MRLAAGASGRRLSASATSATRPAPTRSKHAEPGAVGDAVGPRVAVVDERRAAERPRRHGPARQHRGEREQRRPDAVATEPEPERDAEHRRGDARSRGGQEHRDGRRVGEHRPARDGDARPGRDRQLERKHEQHVGRERERVPVADRVAEPCRSSAVGEERRDRLAGERPDDRRPESRDERCDRPAAGSRAAGAEQEPHDEEGGEDERPVELVPRLGPGATDHAIESPAQAAVASRTPSSAAPPPGCGARPASARALQPPATSSAASAVQTESPAKSAASNNAVAIDTATPGLRIARQATMHPGKLPCRTPGALQTVYLRSPGHQRRPRDSPRLPAPCGLQPTRTTPTLVPRHPPPAVQARRARSLRAGRVRLAARRHRAGSRRRSALRPPGDRRLVAGRPHRRHLRGPLLRRRDREPPARRARLLERAGGHHSARSRRSCAARTHRPQTTDPTPEDGETATPHADHRRHRRPRAARPRTAARRARRPRLRSARARARCPSRC